MSKKVENLLKEGLSIEQEAKAVTAAIIALRQRHGENDLAVEFAQELTVMQKKREGIETMIDSLKNGDVRNIFKSRYLDGQTWEDVSENCYISLAHVYRLHKKGLEELS